MRKILLFLALWVISHYCSAQPTVTLSKTVLTANPSVSTSFYYRIDYSISGAAATSAKIIDTLASPLAFVQVQTSPNISSSSTATVYDTSARRNRTIVTINLAATATQAGSSGQLFILTQYTNGFTPNNYIANNTAYFTASNISGSIASNNASNIANVPGSGSSNGFGQPSLFQTNSGTVLGDYIIYRTLIYDSLIIKNGFFIDSLPVGAKFISARLTNSGGTYASNYDGVTPFVYDSIANTVSYVWGINSSNQPATYPNNLLVSNAGCRGCMWAFEIIVKYDSPIFVVGDVVINRSHFYGQYVTNNLPISVSTQNSLVLTAPVCTGPSVSTVGAPYNRFLVGDSIRTSIYINNSTSTTNSNVSEIIDLSNLGFGINSYQILQLPGLRDSIYIYYQTNVSSSFTPYIIPYFSKSLGNGDTVISFKNLGLASGEFVNKIKVVYTNIYSSQTVYGNAEIAVPSTAATGNILIPISIGYTCSGGSYNKLNNLQFIVTNDKTTLTYRLDAFKSMTGSAQIGDSVLVTLRTQVTSNQYGHTQNTLNDLVIGDLLPANLTFRSMRVGGSNGYYISGVDPYQQGGRTSTFVAQNMPAPTVVNNYQATSQQFVYWDFSSKNLTAIDTLGYQVQFWATVNPGTPYPSVKNYGVSYSKTGSVRVFNSTGGKTATDFLDYNNNGLVSDSYLLDSATLNIAAVSALSAVKSVRGSMDNSYSSNGQTVSGGVANYKLVVKNTGSVAVKNIVLVDILPYNGDKYLVTQQSKNSNWSPFLASAVSVPAGVTVYYSTVEDIDGNDLGITGGINTPNWSTILPNPITLVKAIKFEFANNYPSDSLKAGDSLVLTWPMRVPAGVSVGDTAWNSFAYKGVSVFDGTSLFAEPLKVPIVVRNPQPNIIGNYVWNDVNDNGIQDEPLVNGMNGVRIELYKSADNVVGNGDDLPATDAFGNDVSFTVTGNDVLGNPGFYQFANLPNGNYYIKVITPFGYYITQANIGNSALDSDTDSTGVSSMIILSNNNTNNGTIDVGLTNTDCNVRAGADQNSICLTSLTGYSANILGVGAGIWSSISDNPGTAVILNATSANTLVTNFSSYGSYRFVFTAGSCSDTMRLNVINKPSAGSDQLGICAGTSVTLAGTNNSGVWNAMVSNPTGTSLSSTTAGVATVNTFTGITGTFNFIYTIATCSDTVSVSTIQCCSKPNAGVDVYTCPNSMVSLVGSLPVSGTWYSLSTNPIGALLSATTAGTANVALQNTASGTYGFVYAFLFCTDTMYVKIGLPNNPEPSVNMGSNPICKNGQVQLCPTVWGWSNYQWYRNGNIIPAPTGTGACITIDSTTTGSYTLAASNGASCWSAQSTPIVVTYDSTCNGGSVTGGGGGGVESKTLGDVIALRLYGNAKQSKVEVDGRANGIKYTNSGVITNGAQDLSLAMLIPGIVSGTDIPYVSTPGDLVNFTNAVEVLAVDYTKSNSIKAVAFGTKTLGEVYAHTKPICDRLKGAQLLEVKTMNVNGYNVMAYKVQQCTGEVEYAMNLSAGTSANRNSISLQSNWFTDSYVQDEKLYNFQLWAVSYDMVKEMAQSIVNKLQANGSINVVTATDLPKAYVTSGSRKGRTVMLNINNNTSATTAIVELKEKVTETAQETTRQLPITIAANGTSTVNVDARDNYEATINIYINNKKTDMLYLNDGAWALDYNKNSTTVNSFVVSNEGTVSNNTDEYRLLRNVDFSAISKDYVTVYKNIGTKCQSLSLGNYNSLKFNAESQGSGSVTVTLISSNIINWNDQYSYTINLDGRTEDYAISLNSFRSSKYAQSIQGNSITGVSFAFNSGRGVQSNMAASLSNARFSTATVLGTDNSLSSLGVYPNPTLGNRFTVNFSSSSNQSLVLKVLEVATGRVIKTMFVNATKGTNKQVVELNNTQSNGTYMVTLEGDEVKYNAVKVMMNK